jgi:oxygen-dependent protoporphyrinogen oxidase
VRVGVVGGGLGGLLAGTALVRRGADVVLFEAGPAVGGVAATIREDGYLLEPAAGSFPRPHPALDPLLDHAGVATMARPASARRYVTDGGRFRELPADPIGIVGVAAALLGPAAVARAAGEPLLPAMASGGETVGGHLRRRFGPAGGAAAGLIAGGVFAGDPDRLELAAAFPILAGLEDAHGSILRAVAARRGGAGPRPTLQVPVAGMAALAESLAATIHDVRTATPVTDVGRGRDGWEIDGEPVDRVVLAVAPDTAGKLLGLDLGPNPPTAPVAVVGLGGPADRVPALEGFGGLVLAEAGLATLGVLFETGPGRAPDGHRLLKVLVGGARRPDAVELPDDLLVSTVLAEVGPMLGAAVRPDWIRVRRAAIPQYVRGHADRVTALDAQLAPEVALAGWWYRGIGVASLAADAEVLADRLGA